MPNPDTSATSTGLIDPRGPRFGAVITSVLLVVVLVLGPTSVPGLIVLLVQTVAFAAGSLLGLHTQPWGVIYRKFVRPRLAAPTELEPAEPPRFAQTVGLVFSGTALILSATGFGLAAQIVTGVLIAAAFAECAFGFCLGCVVFGYLQRAGVIPDTVCEACNRVGA